MPAQTEPADHGAGTEVTPRRQPLYPHRGPVDIDELIAFLRRTYPIPADRLRESQPDPATTPAPVSVPVSAATPQVSSFPDPFDTPVHQGPLKGHDPAEWAECCVPPWAELPESGQRPALVADLGAGGEPEPKIEHEIETAAQKHDEASAFPSPVPASDVTTRPLSGLTVLVTGEITGLNRAAANQALEALGAKVASSVGAKTSLVVLGDGAGHSKLAKISTYRIPVLSAAAFLDLHRRFLAGEVVAPPTGESLADYEQREAQRAAAEASEVVDRGSLAAWFGDAPDPVEPDDHLPMERRHLVQMVVVFPLVNGRPVREVRMRCDCGHRWLAETIHTGMRCPNRFVERPDIDSPAVPPAPPAPALPSVLDHAAPEEAA